MIAKFEQLELTLEVCLNKMTFRKSSHSPFLMYLFCFLWTRTLSASPQRVFNQGQLEINQSMDNMDVMETSILTADSMFASKTSILLNEAEKLLATLQDSEEKQWLATFVQRIRGITEILGKDMKRMKPSENLNSMNGATVPRRLLLQSSTVPGSNPFQKIRTTMSKFSMIPPEISQVSPANKNFSGSQIMMKSTMVHPQQINTKDDELVYELESLQKDFNVPVQSFEERVKATFTAKVPNEMTQYQQLSKYMLPNELINALNKEMQVTTDIAEVEKPKTVYMSKYQDLIMPNKVTIDALNDMKTEDKILSIINIKRFMSDGNKSHQGNHQQMKIDYQHIPFSTYGNNFQYTSPQSNEHPYHNILANVVGYLHRPNSLYLHRNYQAKDSTIQHVPDMLRQRIFQPQSMVYNGYSNHKYGLYPNMEQWQNKNLTLKLKASMSPYLRRQPVNHQIDTQFSDEMKRQLRDGKIVVLSDSVVHTNFKSDTNAENKNDEAKQ